MNALPIFHKSLLSDPFCDDVIKLASELDQEKGTIDDGVTDSVRRSTVRWINRDERSEFVYQVLTQIFKDFNRQVFGFNVDHVPEIQFTEYDESEQGHYDWHLDTISDGPVAYDRKLSMSIQLSPNTAYVGGDLQFHDNGSGGLPAEEIRSRGSVIVFPSFMPHRVTPVTQGKRLSLVAWMEGPKFQ